jgi:hypothetical protein
MDTDRCIENTVISLQCFLSFFKEGRKEGSNYQKIQGGSNVTGTNCDLFTHNQSRSYLNHLVL